MDFTFVLLPVALIFSLVGKSVLKRYDVLTRRN